MKITFSFIAVFLFIVAANAQSKTIGKEKYDNIFESAGIKTNEAYPFIFKIVTNIIEKGKTVRTLTEVRENQLSGFSRIKKTEVSGGREDSSYQLTVGYNNIFCSDDGISWKSSKYMCGSSVMVFSRVEPESTEYRVTEKTLEGKKAKVYREFSVFASSQGSPTKEFSEKVSTIDSRGFLITIVGTEGTLDPKKVTLTREQSWITNAKIEPVVAPKKLIN